MVADPFMVADPWVREQYRVTCGSLCVQAAERSAAGRRRRLTFETAGGV